MQSPFNSSALGSAARSLRLRNLFRDDLGRIAMPVVLLLVPISIVVLLSCQLLALSL
jgi:hypothetical protein